MTSTKKMTTLVIHAPGWAAKKGAKSFDWVLQHNMGYRYAIYNNYLSKINPGCRVVVLQKDKPQRRAEGELVELVPTGAFTRNGIQRFDIYIKNLTIVPYSGVALNRCGVALIDC